MAKIIGEGKKFKGGGMDTDSAEDFVSPIDYLESFNIQNNGNVEQEEGIITNIASTVEVLGYSLPAGLNKCMGADKFEDVRKAYYFNYNSFGYHQLGEYDIDSNIKTLLFTNLTDSGGIDILPLTPTNYVRSIKLVNGTSLYFSDGNIEIGNISIPRLKSGGYGVVTADDFRLIKAQPIKIPTSVYNDDKGRVVNLLKEKLFQFRSQYIYLDDEPSTYSSFSKRPVPIKESTTGVGEDVTKNNNLIVTIPLGTNRVKEYDIVARYSKYNWFNVKSVTRDYVLAIPFTSVDISQERYEAYDPTTNTYSFIFYNDGSYVNIDPVETDSEYDRVPQKAETLEIINGNIVGVGGITEGYARPVVDVNITVSNYDPNLEIGHVDPDPLRIIDAGSNTKKASHARDITVKVGGIAKTGDTLRFITADIRDWNNALRVYTYVVEPAYNNNTLGALRRMASGYMPGVGVIAFNEHDYYVITWVDFQYYDIKSAVVELSSVGTGQFSSIHALKLNSAYQAALQYYDRYGRTFPLITGNNFIFKTNSYAQSRGLTPRFSWTINNPAPVGAVSYQWLLSENTTHQNTLYMDCKYLRVDGNYLVVSLNPLKIFNKRNSSSILNYQYSAGDRATFNYYDNAGTKVWFDNPYIDVQVVGFEIVTDTSTTPVTEKYELKMRLNSSLDLAAIDGKNVYIEIYTPKKRVVVSGTTTTYLTNLFYEVGEQFNIVNGVHEVTTSNITDGDVYFKTRDLVSAVDETTYNTYLAEDFNFSDLYESKYTSYGRGFLYNDRDGIKIRKASIRYSGQFVIDSRVNMLNRFYSDRLFGEGDGETSSNYGWIRKLRQRGNYIVCIQDVNVCHIPVFSTIVEDQSSQNQAFLSDKLLNKVRYGVAGNYGCGNAFECYCESPNGTIYFVDANNSVPLREGYDGLRDISMKMSKFFKKTIHKNKEDGRDIIAYWDNYTRQAVFSTQVLADGVTKVIIDSASFILDDPYVISQSDVTIVTPPAKGTVVLVGGNWIYTPNHDQTGTDSFSFSFVVDGNTITKNQCGFITPGVTTINPFIFVDLVDQELSTLLVSNIVLITGNNIGVPISITGGEYQINGGSWTSFAGTVFNGDTVTVRQTSSASNSTTTHAVLTVSSYSDSFDVTTKSDIVPDPFTFTPVTNATLSTLYASNTITVSGIDAPSPISIVDGSYQINGGTWGTTSGVISNGNTVAVRRISSPSNNTLVSTTLTIGGVSGTDRRAHV